MQWPKIGNAPLRKQTSRMVKAGNLSFQQQGLQSWIPRNLLFLVEAEAKTNMDFVDATKQSPSMDQREKAIAAFRGLYDLMYPTCTLHNADFET